MTCENGLPASLNLSIYQGATFSQVLTWETGDPPEPVDLTGYTAAMVIASGQTEIINLTDGDGIILGGTDGTVTLNIDATTTAEFNPGNAIYDLLLTSAGGIVYPLVAGLVSIRASVTGG